MAAAGRVTSAGGRRPRVLVVDVGGTHVKVLATGHRTPRALPSGPSLTAREMVAAVKRLTADWSYDAVSLGYPGVVARGHPIAEPHNLGRGWTGFDFPKAFGCPVQVVNDAALQALGSYRGGRMLFLGLGTGLGTALILDGVLQPMELGHLPYRKGRTYEEYVGAQGLKRLGRKRWRRHVARVVTLLKTALEADDVVLGGGNARRLKDCPPGVRLVGSANAFAGGFRLWDARFAPSCVARRARAARPPPRAGRMRRAGGGG